MSESDSEYNNQFINFIPNQIGEYFQDNNSNNSSGNIFGRLQDMAMVQKQNSGLKNLAIFSQIIWMNDCLSDREKKIFPVLKLNFQVIYGEQFLCFQTKQSVLEYIKNQHVGQIEVKVNNQFTQINAPLYLILCNNSLLPYFETNLSTTKQVYKKCLLFRDYAQNTNTHVYGSIKQAYDIVEVVQKLIKYLFELNYKNARTMYQQFNVYLEDQDQIDDNYNQGMYMGVLNYQAGQMYEGGLQPISTITQSQIIQEAFQQQLIKNLPICKNQQIKQKQQQKQIQSGQLDEIIQKYFVQKALKEIIGTDLECRFDPSAVSLIVMTSSPECRQYQSGEILIRNNSQIKQLLQSEQKPKLILLTSQIQKQDEEISQNQQTYIWIKCKLPIQTLTPEQITLYKTKYNKDIKSHSTKIKKATSIDEMVNILRQAQDILENSMF